MRLLPPKPQSIARRSRETASDFWNRLGIQYPHGPAATFANEFRRHTGSRVGVIENPKPASSPREPAQVLNRAVPSVCQLTCRHVVATSCHPACDPLSGDLRVSESNIDKTKEAAGIENLLNKGAVL